MMVSVCMHACGVFLVVIARDRASAAAADTLQLMAQG